MRSYIILTIFAACFSPQGVTANKLYISTDQYGNKVFTDKAPDSGNYLIKERTQIKPVIWKKTPKLKGTFLSAKKTRKKRAQNLEPTKKQRCGQYSKKINQLQKQLKQKQNPQQFDFFKQKLRELRWQYQKSC